MIAGLFYGFDRLSAAKLIIIAAIPIIIPPRAIPCSFIAVPMAVMATVIPIPTRGWAIGWARRIIHIIDGRVIRTRWGVVDGGRLVIRRRG